MHRNHPYKGNLPNHHRYLQHDGGGSLAAIQPGLQNPKPVRDIYKADSSLRPDQL